jgi:hypothetical protein
MAPVNDLQRVLWVVTILAGVLTVARLYRLDLHRIYRYFWIYLALRTARSAFLYFLADRSSDYAWTWVLTQPLVWILYVLIVLELYSLVFGEYPGIYTLSRWVLSGGLIVAVALSAASFWLTSAAPPDNAPVIRYYTLIERGVDSSLVIFLLILVAFLAWYPVPLRRNALAHSIVYCVFFISNTGVLLVRNIAGLQVHEMVNTGVLAISSICVLAWLFLFSREGETRKASLRNYFQPGDEMRAIEQLGALNRSLTRAVQR